MFRFKSAMYLDGLCISWTPLKQCPWRTITPTAKGRYLKIVRSCRQRASTRGYGCLPIPMSLWGRLDYLSFDHGWSPIWISFPSLSQSPLTRESETLDHSSIGLIRWTIRMLSAPQDPLCCYLPIIIVEQSLACLNIQMNKHVEQVLVLTK